MSRTVSRTTAWKSTYVVVEISPRTMTSPVVVAVSHATRAFGSSRMIASRMASDTWSHILSGWPSVTDSDVNRYCAASTMLVIWLLFGVRRRVPRPLSDAGPERFEVEVALDPSERRVVDDPVVPEADHGIALHRHDLQADRPMVDELALRLIRRLLRVRPDVARLMVETVAHLIDARQVVGIGLAELLEPGKGSLDGGEARLGLLRIGAVDDHDPETPDDQRQCQALSDEGAEDDGEREEQDEIAVRAVLWAGEG